jgi:hypothetical protein
MLVLCTRSTHRRAPISWSVRSGNWDYFRLADNREQTGLVNTWFSGLISNFPHRMSVASPRRLQTLFIFIHAENDYSLSSGKVLDARREHIGKPHRLKIYPPIGHTVDDGHDFLYLGVNIWEPDVFAFLDENMRK